MGSHINKDGLFQSDKYPTCPAGKVPLSVNDATAQDLLWQYAQRRRAVDAEFSNDLEIVLKAAGFKTPTTNSASIVEALSNATNALGEIMHALAGRRLLARGVANETIRARFETEALSDNALEGVAARAFEAACYALHAAGSTDVTIHECKEIREEDY